MHTHLRLLPIFVLLNAGPLYGADVTLPAVFTVNPVVAAPDPGAWTATTGGGTVNAVNGGGGFEPLCFKWRWQATGDAPDSLILAESDIDGWDTFNEGFYEGASVRIYRAYNNELVKVRDDRIAAHHVKRWAYSSEMIDADTTTFRESLPGWYSPLETYYWAVMAVDHNGNESPVSNIVSAGRNVVTGATVTNDTHAFTRPLTPSETVAPAAPTNLQIALDESTGVFTLTWNAVAAADLEGYVVRMSYWPPEEISQPRIELEGRATDPWHHVRRGDLIYIDLERTEWDPRELISPRLYGDYSSSMPTYWPWDITRLDPRRVQHLVAHPEPIPEAFTASQRGQTCLHVGTEIEDDEVILGQYNHAGTNQTWYQVLEVGATYIVEAWMRQEGIPGGTVTFRLGGDYLWQTWDDPTDAYVPWIDFQVTGEWVKYTATFVIPGPYDDEGVGTTELLFTGPGQLWVDNFRVYKQGTDYMDWPVEDYQVLEESRLGAIRTHQFIKSGYSYTMETLTNPAGVAGSSGNNTRGDQTLPHILDIMERGGTDPWLQIETSQSEEEWLGLVEFLAAPYDPAVDTQLSKPWAYKRYNQGHPAPWVDSFDTIYFEISNEMWNTLGGFAPWSVNGVNMSDAATGENHDGPAVQGMIQEYVLDVMKTSPYWPLLAPKWEVVIGGWHGNLGEDDWGFAAVKKCPDIQHVTWANYNGGWDEGALPLTANDEGRFLALTVVPHSHDASNRAFAQTRDNMAAQGYHFDIGTYEAGPGYSLNGLNGAQVSDAQQEAESQVMKGLTGGTGTLDAFLNGALYGMKLQNFFTLDRGRTHWRSHARHESGLQAYPPWLAMEMYNGYAQGDFLVVTTNSVPTANLAPTLTRPETTDAPVAACYATRSGNQFGVFVLSRILDNYPVAGDDGYIPVTLRLPFTACTGIRLYRMQGDPRAHNLDSAEIVLEELTIPANQFAQEFTLNAARGASDLGLPPAASYLYVFEGVTEAPPSAQPEPVISVAAGMANPTLQLPIEFDVVFSEPVSGFDEADVTFDGTAPVLDFGVSRAPIGAGAVYRISVKSLANSGTISPRIPAGGCRGQLTDALNSGSTFDGQPISYDLPPEGGVALNDVIGDVETAMNSDDSSDYRGTNTSLYLYGPPDAGWAHSAYMRFPVVNCLDRTISSAVLRIYKMGPATPTLGIWAVEDDTWQESQLNGSNRPDYGVQLTSLTLPATEGYVDFDLTDYVIAETSKDAAVSILIGEVTSGGTGYYSLIAREGPGSGYPPLPDAPPALAITWGPSNNLPNCVTPDASSAGGTFLGSQTVTLTSATEGATIRYTLDGTVPDAGNGQTYTGPITVSATAILRAVALADGFNPSGVRNIGFEIFNTATQPVTAEPSSGAFSGPVDIVLTCATPGATIRFTLDGSTPSRDYGYIYNGPINIASDRQVRAIAYTDTDHPSNVLTGSYYLNGDVFLNRISFPGGGIISASSQADADRGPAAVIDDDYWTRWEIESNAGWLQYEFADTSAYSVDRYAVGTSPSGPGSCAANWTLMGSNNGTTWTSLDTRSNVVFYTAGTNQYYDIANPAAYRYYRLDFTNSTGDAYTSIGGFELLDLNESAPDFIAWRGLHFTTEEIAAGLAGDLRDDDGDSIPVILEYAYGTDPMLAGTAGPLFISSSAMRTLSVPLALRNDLDLYLELSTDLQSWSVGASSLGGEPLVLGETVEAVTFDAGVATFTLSAGESATVFCRVRVVRR